MIIKKENIVMMTKETKTRIEDALKLKDIEVFLIVLDTCTAKKIGIPDLRAYVRDMGIKNDIKQPIKVEPIPI